MVTRSGRVEPLITGPLLVIINARPELITTIMMMQTQQRVIWTVGHSTHSIEEFIAVLRSFRIEWLVDIRMFPGSRRYPHFNQEALEASQCRKQM